jgi:PAS domain-containing protein
MVGLAQEASGLHRRKLSDAQQSDRSDSSDRLHVFISYSRDDLHFANQLDAALKVCGFVCLIDRHGISGGEDWKHRLSTMISEADTVVFVLSPASAWSEVCAWEVQEAVRLGKRTFSVICRPLEGTRPPPHLRDRNYIFFHEDARVLDSGFGTGLAILTEALNTDFEWLREHTRYLQRAMEWEGGGRPTNRLLSGNDIAEAKAWMARQPKNALKPTELHLDFIRASDEESALRLQRELANELNEDLQKALSDPDTEPEGLVRRVMHAVKRIIPYDLATFGIYSEDMNYYNALVVDPQPVSPWLTAWFPLSAEVREFLQSNLTWGADLRVPELNEDPILKRVTEDGMASFVTLPIGGGGRSLRASLTLLSKQVGRYNGHEIAIMRERGLERALLVAEAKITRRYEERARQLEDDLKEASGGPQLAAALARGISDYFGWDHIGIFALHHGEERFRVIAEHNATDRAAVLSEYSQPFTAGVLGAALRENRPIIINDVETNATATFKTINPGLRSAAVLPVYAGRRQAETAEITWMVSIESYQSNAFQGPNMQALKYALARCEALLSQHWYESVQSALLDAVDQALVLVDRAGKIRLINLRARMLFGSMDDQLFDKTLATFGAQDSDKRLLASVNSLPDRRVNLSIDQRVTVPVLATHRTLEHDSTHRLWLFTDLRENTIRTD